MTTTTSCSEFSISPIAADRLPGDLAAVNAQDGGEAYAITLYGADGLAKAGDRARLLWLPEIRRGGVCLGGGATWTDADSAEDCVRRVLTGESIQ
jgi:hypothetical protein